MASQLSAVASGPIGSLASSNGRWREFRGGQREAQVDQRALPRGIGRQRPRQSGHGTEDAPHVATDLVQHRQAIAGVAGLVAQFLQLALEHRVLVGHLDHARPRVAADGEVLRQRRQQLIVRRAGSQELDVDRPHLDFVRHHRSFLGWLPTCAEGTGEPRPPTQTTSDGRRAT